MLYEKAKKHNTYVWHLLSLALCRLALHTLALAPSTFSTGTLSYIGTLAPSVFGTNY